MRLALSVAAAVSGVTTEIAYRKSEPSAPPAPT